VCLVEKSFSKARKTTARQTDSPWVLRGRERARIAVL
jgi:hypothetical protein